MITLDACTSFCTAMSTTLGPTITEILLGALGLLLVWWRNRKHVAAVLAPVVARADAAEKKASEAHLQLVELRGSLRPVGLSTPTPPSSSSSGHWEPVTMPFLPDGVQKPKASMPDPRLSGEEPLPLPSRVPVDTRAVPASEDDIDTRPDTPTARRR